MKKIIDYIKRNLKSLFLYAVCVAVLVWIYLDRYNFVTGTAIIIVIAIIAGITFILDTLYLRLKDKETSKAWLALIVIAAFVLITSYEDGASEQRFNKGYEAGYESGFEEGINEGYHQYEWELKNGYITN